MKEINGIKKGVDVDIINTGQCYPSYVQLIMRHPQYALRWCYKGRPNKDHVFLVRGVYNHCMEDECDDCKYAVIVEDTSTKQLYIMGELGLKVHS